MNEKAKKAYDELKRKHQREFAIVRKVMMIFAQHGGDHLTPEQFRWEGRFPTGMRDGSKARVGVIKGFQARFYGGVSEVNDRLAFIALEYDQKKRDQANQKLLRSTARKLGPYLVSP